MFLKLVSVFIGGGIGATLRYFSTILSNKIFTTSIFGTLFVNIVGCFFIGCILGITTSKPNIFSDLSKTFLTVGFLGGLTTFSTFNIEVFELIKSDKIFLGFSYMIFSCLLGLLFAYLGYLICSKI